MLSTQKALLILAILSTPAAGTARDFESETLTPFTQKDAHVIGDLYGEPNGEFASPARASEGEGPSPMSFTAVCTATCYATDAFGRIVATWIIQNRCTTQTGRVSCRTANNPCRVTAVCD